MSKKKLQARYDKLLKEFNEGHNKLEKIKLQMVDIRKKILAAPVEFDERPDEILLKES